MYDKNTLRVPTRQPARGVPLQVSWTPAIRAMKLSCKTPGTGPLLPGSPGGQPAWGGVCCEVRTLLASLILLTFILTLPAAAQQSPQLDKQAKRTEQPTGDATKLLREAAPLLQAGQLDAAEPLVRGALRAAPQNADAHNLLGVILDQRGKFSEAEHAYRTALRFNPGAISPLANLGVLLARTGRQEEAVSTFEAVLRAAPDHLQATINLGLLYAARRNYKQAAELLRRANERQPNTFDILYRLGMSLYNLNREELKRSRMQDCGSKATGVASA